MSPSRRRQANPHFGAYYGILTSAFVSLVISLAMFEQLGVRPQLVTLAKGLANGLPIGAQIIGPLYEDDAAITFAELLADVVGGYQSPPV